MEVTLKWPCCTFDGQNYFKRSWKPAARWKIYHWVIKQLNKMHKYKITIHERITLSYLHCLCQFTGAIQNTLMLTCDFGKAVLPVKQYHLGSPPSPEFFFHTRIEDHRCSLDSCPNCANRQQVNQRGVDIDIWTFDEIVAPWRNWNCNQDDANMPSLWEQLPECDPRWHNVYTPFYWLTLLKLRKKKP